MYEDETGYQKGEIQKRKIVETEIFSVDERIKIIRNDSNIISRSLLPRIIIWENETMDQFLN